MSPAALPRPDTRGRGGRRIAHRAATGLDRAGLRRRRERRGRKGAQPMGFGDDHHLGSHRGQNVLAPLRRWVQRRAHRPESAVRAAQDPTASIQAVPDALAVAESLLGSAPLVCGAYGGAVTVRPLAALLYAA